MDAVSGIVRWVLILGIIALAGYAIYYFWFSDSSSSGDLTGGSPLDGNKTTTINAHSIPPSSEGAYGVSFWCYISDWKYKFGQEKSILSRTDASGNCNPCVSLHPTDNILLVKTSHLPLKPDPVPASAGDITYQKFECQVPNIPLQGWFSVSIGQFTRNQDVYINGGLVTSCVIPGVPIQLSTDSVIGSNGGFAGKVAGITFLNRALTPVDAQAYFAKGVPGGSSGGPGGLGLNFKVAVINDATNKEIHSFML